MIYVTKSCHNTTNVWNSDVANHDLNAFLLNFSAWNDKHMMYTEYYTAYGTAKVPCTFVEVPKEFYYLAQQDWFRRQVRMRFGADIFV